MIHLHCDSADLEDEVMPTSKVSQFVEDATFGYQDFARRGEDNPPTFRAQVGDNGKP